jgi:hypothetical protein
MPEEARRRAWGGPRGAHTTPRCGPPLATPRHGVVALAHLWHRALRISSSREP